MKKTRRHACNTAGVGSTGIICNDKAATTDSSTRASLLVPPVAKDDSISQSNVSTQLNSPLAGLDLDHELALGVRLAGTGAGHLDWWVGQQKSEEMSSCLPAYPTRGRSQPQFEILEVSRKDFLGKFSAVGFSLPS